MKKHLVSMLALVILLLNCTSGNQEIKKGFGIDLSNMDTTVLPGDDFFRYANGGWINKTSIPKDQTSWGSFSEVQARIEQSLLTLITEAASDERFPQGSDQRKVTDFYLLGMDSLLAEKVGIKPIVPMLKMIELIKDKSQIYNYLIEDILTGFSTLFELSVLPDFKNNKRNVLYLTAGELGLPDRDYYLKNDPKSKEIRFKYTKHLTNLFLLLGIKPEVANRQSDIVLKIETRLAAAMLSKAASRNPHNIYHPLAIREMPTLASSINWDLFLKGLSIPVDSLIVCEPSFIKAYEEINQKYTLEEIKYYLKASLLRKASPYLHHAFVQESFEFNERYLNGVEQLRPRYKRVLESLNEVLGDALGQMFVGKEFSTQAKLDALEMVTNIRLAFAERIKNLDWMSDSTKIRALQKLASLQVKVGYPDKWKDYVGLPLEKEGESVSYFRNLLIARKYKSIRVFSSVGKEVNRQEWQLSAQTVNAYYDPLLNEIVFPAAIFNPPFYDFKADDAVNYGAIGAIIGHEISHAFDDQGARFDNFGELTSWFHPLDYAQFTDRGKLLITQYNQYQTLPGVFVQGEFTLGENIGDLGGVTAAYWGLARFLREHPEQNPGKVDGYTPQQRFFISWASIWRVKHREEALRKRAYTDPHAPGMFRTNGPLVNFTPFYEAFNVKPENKMYKPEAERVKLW